MRGRDISETCCKAAPRKKCPITADDEECPLLTLKLMDTPLQLKPLPLKGLQTEHYDRDYTGVCIAEKKGTFESGGYPIQGAAVGC